VLAEAKRYLGVTEHPPGSNRGVEVDYWVLECGLDPVGAYPWCAAWVGQMGRQALGTAWPCPRTASVQQLVLWAKSQPGRWQNAPAVGDLFVLWNTALKRYAHVGFVVAIHGTQVTTYEGNTSGGGSREGWGVFERTRPSGGSDIHFIRWA